VYVSPLSGRGVARRSSTWRVYDFLWSLHIMDYRDREDFNNWLVVISAAVALALTVSGFVILAYRFLFAR
ncbi:MAG: PepSY domain-containing protein, partial [Alphaproteobacteria bacterium]